MTVSQIISTTIDMVRLRIGSLLGLWFVFLAVQIVFSLAFFALIGSTTALAAGGFGTDGLGAGGVAGLGIGIILAMFLFYVIYSWVAVAQNAALSAKASPLINPNFGEAIATGFKSGLVLLVSSILLVIGYFIVAFALGTLFAALSALGDWVRFFAGLLTILLFVYLLCRVSVIAPVAAVDGVRNPATIISRAWRMTGGNVLQIFLSLLVYALATMALFGIVFAAFYGTITGLAAGNEASGLATLALLVVSALVVLSIVSITGAALISALHAAMSDASPKQLGETFE